MMKWCATLALAALCAALPVSARSAQLTVSGDSGVIFDGSPPSIGTTSIQVLAAVPNGGKRQTLFIQLNTSSATLTCNSNGVAVLGTHPGITISGLLASLNYANLGTIPNTAIQCVASITADITVLAFPQ